MLKNILNINGTQQLSKNEQQSINGGGGTRCVTYPADKCTDCGGYPLLNGCCLGTSQTHCCLTGLCR